MEITKRFEETGTEDQVISIDSSQGREFDIVFVSMVRTKPGSFIHEYNRINVALTRAKHGLVVIGNENNLRKDEKWNKLLDEHKDNVVNGTIGAQLWVNKNKEKLFAEVFDQE